jgi:hypothetical protein
LVVEIRKTAVQAVAVAVEPILPMVGLVLQIKALLEETIKAAAVALARLETLMEQDTVVMA